MNKWYHGKKIALIFRLTYNWHKQHISTYSIHVWKCICYTLAAPWHREATRCVIIYRCTPAPSSHVSSVLETTRSCSLSWPTLSVPSGPTTVFERLWLEVTSLSWTTLRCSEYDLHSPVQMEDGNVRGKLSGYEYVWLWMAPVWEESPVTFAGWEM